MTRQIEDTRQLPPRANARLVQLWRRMQSDERRVPRADLRDIAREVSRDAHAAGLYPEDLIIALKESWIEGGGMRHTSERGRWQPTLTDLISLCVVEYYLVPGVGESARAPSNRRRQPISDIPRAYSP